MTICMCMFINNFLFLCNNIIKFFFKRILCIICISSFQSCINIFNFFINIINLLTNFFFSNLNNLLYNFRIRINNNLNRCIIFQIHTSIIKHRHFFHTAEKFIGNNSNRQCIFTILLNNILMCNFRKI